MKIEIDLTPEQIEAITRTAKVGAAAWPQVGDDYEHISSNGDVCADYWANTDMDNARLAVGNVYRPGTAQAVVDKRKAEVRVRKYIAENGLEWTPSWKDKAQGKYSIYYSHDNNVFEVSYSSRSNFNVVVWFKSESDAQQVIDNCSDDLRIMWGI